MFLENLAFIRPFFPFENLAFFETAYAKFCLLCFLGPGNPVKRSRLARIKDQLVT